MTVREAGIEPHAYFLFKFKYENNRKYAFEKLEDYNNFEDFVPIVDK